MSYKIRLPDDRFLEIGLRDSLDDETEAKVIPIEELEPEPEEEVAETTGGGRRIGRFIALGGLAVGSLVLIRSLRRRRGRESPTVEISEEDELTAK